MAALQHSNFVYCYTDSFIAPSIVHSFFAFLLPPTLESPSVPIRVVLLSVCNISHQLMVILYRFQRNQEIKNPFFAVSVILRNIVFVMMEKNLTKSEFLIAPIASEQHLSLCHIDVQDKLLFQLQDR